MRFEKQCIIHQHALERAMFRKQLWMTQLVYSFIFFEAIWSSLFVIVIYMTCGELIKHSEELNTMREILEESQKKVT